MIGKSWAGFAIFCIIAIIIYWENEIIIYSDNFYSIMVSEFKHIYFKALPIFLHNWSIIWI